MAARHAARRTIVGLVAGALILTVAATVPATAGPSDRTVERDAAELRAIAAAAPAREDATKPLPSTPVRAASHLPRRTMPLTLPTPPRLPGAWHGLERVAPDGADSAERSGAAAGSELVRVGRAEAADEAAAATAAVDAGPAVASVAVDILDAAAAERAGVDGLLLRIGGGDSTPPSTEPSASPSPATTPAHGRRTMSPERPTTVRQSSFSTRRAVSPTDVPSDPASGTPTTPPATPTATPDGPATSTPSPRVSGTPSPSPSASAAPAADGSRVPAPAQEAAPATDAPLEVAVDYSSFAGAYGGGWSSRLRLVQLPDCALTTPERAECRTQTPIGSVNDTRTSTVTATLSSTGSVLALAAGASGKAGTFSATPLSPSSSWQVSGQTGSFSWSYPLRVPPSVGGPEPELALSYTSSAVDGKVASTNNQSSWVGDGWDLGTGFVERKYVPCSQDATGSANNLTRLTGDLCWQTDNATLALAGHSSELVKDAASGTWRLKEDDGTRVERLTGGWNDDNDGEYWKVTTTDGTQYFFGRGQRSASDTTKTSSAWSVPVYGNHPGDPCYAATFAASQCRQTWRWNLEYIVDTSGNTLTTFYTPETNSYGRNLGEAVSTYVRGGYPHAIEYGQRAGTEASTAAPMRVELSVAERCIPSSGVTCDPATLSASTASSWPDVPSDLICTSTTSCPAVTSPAFFTRKRLTGITTQVRTGSTYQNVDVWTLTQSFPDPGDSTDRALWLDRIGHKGVAGTEVALPDIRIYGVQMANRVDTLGDAGPPMNRYRVNAIDTETGARVSVNYTPQDCSPTSLPVSPDQNTRRCFPVRWQPEGTGPQISEYFHKYLVTSIVENPNDDNSLSVFREYSYQGGAAWRFDDNPLVPVAERTWNEFRGYATVDVMTGAPNAAQRSVTRTRYFRGMHGDRLANGGTRTVLVDGIADEDRLNGFVREEISYDGVGGAEVEGTVSTPWISAPTATATDGTRATLVGVGSVEERVTAPALPGGKRTTRIVTTFDGSYGLPTQVDDQGDVATTADDRCRRVEYARNTTAHIVALTSRTELVAVGCGVTPNRPTDVISDERVAYDGLAVGAAPTRGLVTTSQSLKSYVGSSPTYLTDSTTTYDAHGRPTSATDALGRTTTTSYTPSTGGPLTSTSQTTPDPDGTGPLTAMTSSTDVNPAWGVPTRSVDPNGKVTSATVDALGRTTAVWLPGRPQATATPDMTFAYAVSTTGPNTVTTRKLTAKLDYQTTVELYDGMLRPRQTQTTGASRDNPGRLVTDTGYDSRGLVQFEHGPWFTTGSPAGSLVRATAAVPARTRYLYDGAGRTTAEIFDVGEVEGWRSTTTYGGDRVSVDPPDGTAPETTITDARGQVVELLQYTGNQPTGAAVSTTYAYDRAGRRTSVTDAAGNRWTYTYDLRGRLVSTTDPDKGTSTTTYDDAGQVVSTTDARSRTSFVVRDLLGRPTEQRKSTATGELQASWAYDTLAKGQLTSSTRYESGAAYTTAVTGYDDGYRPLGQSVTIPAAEGAAIAGTYTATYRYTADGQRDQIKLPAVGNLRAETVTTYFDALSVPEWMSGGTSGVYVSGSLYDVYGELLRYGVGNTYVDFVNYGYEVGTRRLTKTWLQRQGQSAYDTDLTYTYDNAGNPTSIVDRPTSQPVDAQCFAYDGLQRLSRAWTPADANCVTAPSVAGLGGPAPYWTDWSFDTVGNRTGEVSHTAAGDVTRTYTYPAATTARPHAVSQVTTTSAAGTTTDTYGYDAAGNTTTRNRAGKPSQTLTWNDDGRLSTVTDSGTTSAGSYVYTPEGDRLVRRQGGVTTVYLPGGQELNLTVATGAVTATRYYGFGGNTVAVRTGPTMSDVTSLVNDPHQTASLAIGNVAHTVTNRRTDPYGNVRGTSPTLWPGDHGFLNKPLDATGLTQVGARYYDSTIGRFLSVDPVMDLDKPQQWAAYSYADNNPVTYWDPTGMLSWGSVWKSVKSGASSMGSGVAGFVKKYQAEIVGFAVGGLVTAGCLVVTGGAGSVGCAALGGAAGGAATNLWKTKVQKTQQFSWAGLARDTAIGGLLGATGAKGGQLLMRIPGVQRAATAVGNTIKSTLRRPTTAVGPRGGAAPPAAKPSNTAPQARPNTSPQKGAPSSTESSAAGGGSDELAGAACSFGGATPVLMATGAHRPIEEVRVGDVVLATDPESGDQHQREVTRVWVHTDELFAVNVDGERIVTTEDHPFWSVSEQRWKRADGLRVGELVLSANGAAVSVTGSLDRLDHDVALAYNLSVAGLHTYHVGLEHVLVHNRNTCNVNPISQSQADDIATFLGYTPTKHQSAAGPRIWEIRKPGSGQPRFITWDRNGHRGGIFKGSNDRKNPFSTTKESGRDGTFDLDVSEAGDVVGLTWIAP